MDSQKHSGLGISSFITSIVSAIFIFLTFVIAGVMETSTPGGLKEDSTGAAMIGLFIFAFMGVALIALGLGIAGLLQKDRKKIFAILGTVFASVSIVAPVFLIIIGVATQ